MYLNNYAIHLNNYGMYLKNYSMFDVDNVSEWLRRQIRNLLGTARASSNLVVVDF